MQFGSRQRINWAPNADFEQKARTSLHKERVRWGRFLCLPEPLVEQLRARRARQQTWKDSAGERWNETGLVCTTAAGSAIDHRNTLRRFVRVCRQAKVPRLRIYDPRHTATSRSCRK
jgi:integrase